ncbi:hypothetical protein ACFVH4_08840 [Nocardia ignorata]|uniref:hypothetical protein n=1 Tax=Nocardia ignorata TaxID=145285 RepID=UPI003631C9CB
MGVEFRDGQPSGVTSLGVLDDRSGFHSGGIVMRELNGRVDIDGEDPADVAYEWLKSANLIE